MSSGVVGEPMFARVVVRWVSLGPQYRLGVWVSGAFSGIGFYRRFCTLGSLDGASDIQVMHAWGNDLGVRPQGSFLRVVKLGCLRLWATYTGILLVWSDIVARQVRRNAWSHQGLIGARAKLHKAWFCFIARSGGVVVRHRNLKL